MGNLIVLQMGMDFGLTLVVHISIIALAALTKYTAQPDELKGKTKFVCVKAHLEKRK